MLLSHLQACFPFVCTPSAPSLVFTCDLDSSPTTSEAVSLHSKLPFVQTSSCLTGLRSVIVVRLSPPIDFQYVANANFAFLCATDIRFRGAEAFTHTGWSLHHRCMTLGTLLSQAAVPVLLSSSAAERKPLGSASLALRPWL